MGKSYVYRLAENTTEFFNTLYVTYSEMEQNNEKWMQLCQDATKNNGFPPGIHFLWKNNSETKSVQLDASSYIVHVFVWIETQIEDEAIFPCEEDVPFPVTFRKALRKIFQRMFRIYVIILANKCLYSETDTTILFAGLKSFLYFAWYWRLLSFEEMEKFSKQPVLLIRQEYENDVTKLHQS